MLIHKKSLGALQYMWNKAGTRIVPGTFQNYPEAKPDEWWEIDSESLLAFRIAKCYPDFIPITNNRDQLIDILDLRIEAKKEERKKLDADRRRTAKAKGYATRYNMGQRENWLDFLSDAVSRAQENVYRRNYFYSKEMNAMMTER